jgi:hypothetical protein
MRETTRITHGLLSWPLKEANIETNTEKTLNVHVLSLECRIKCLYKDSWKSSRMLEMYFLLQEHPPQCLLEYHPLADYCNGILSAFNELRLCAPIALAHTATNHLRESMGAVVRCTLAFYRQEQQALTQAEKDNFTRFCACFAGQLLPYIQKCLHALFPPTVIASHLGVTLQHLQKEVYIK